MSTLGQGRGPARPAVAAKMQTATARAVSTADRDSGWVATPANKTFVHKLGVLPKIVLVYASENKTGDSFSTDTATAVTSNHVVFTGPKAYARVLVYK